MKVREIMLMSKSMEGTILLEAFGRDDPAFTAFKSLRATPGALARGHGASRGEELLPQTAITTVDDTNPALP